MSFQDSLQQVLGKSKEKISQAGDVVGSAAKQGFSSLINFLNLKQVGSILLISILLLTTSLGVLKEISNLMSTSVYEIKFYTTDEANERFQGGNIDETYKTLEQLINFGSVFTYTFLKNNGFSLNEGDGLYKLVKENISNYNSNNINFNQHGKGSLIGNVKQLQIKYGMFGSEFDKFIFHDKVSKIKTGGEYENKIVFKDPFVNTGGTLLKSSCLLPGIGKRTISETGECSGIGYYVALKEFMLENSDIDITFPLKVGQGYEDIYIKKFNENGSLTPSFQQFKKFLEEKDITNVFYQNNGLFKKNGLLNGIKKSFFYQYIFDGIFQETIGNEFYSGNTMDLVKRKFYTNSGEKKSENSTANTTGNTENNDGNTTEKKKTENEKEEEKNTGIYEENGSLYVDGLTEIEISTLNFNITRFVTEKLSTSFNYYLDKILDSKNKIQNGNGSCIMKLHGTNLVLKYDNDYVCESVKKMKGKEKSTGIFSEIEERTEQFSKEKITTVNFNIPMFGISVSEGMTGFWVVGVQKLDNQDYLALKKFYFQHESIGDQSIQKLGTVIGVILGLLFIVFYFSFYLSILFIISLVLLLMFIQLSEEFTKGEQTGKQIGAVEKANSDLDSVIG